MRYVREKELKKECNKLGLKQIPILKETKDDTFMQVPYRTDSYENTGIITDVHPVYEVQINPVKMDKLRNKLFKLTNNVDIKYDVTMTALRHELRHVYQHEHCMGLGYNKCKLDDCMDLIQWMEDDADNWMINSAPSRREKVLAQYVNVLTHKKNKCRQKELEDKLKKLYATGIRGWIYNL